MGDQGPSRQWQSYWAQEADVEIQGCPNGSLSWKQKYAEDSETLSINPTHGQLLRDSCTGQDSKTPAEDSSWEAKETGRASCKFTVQVDRGWSSSPATRGALVNAIRFQLCPQKGHALDKTGREHRPKAVVFEAGETLKCIHFNKD